MHPLKCTAINKSIMDGGGGGGGGDGVELRGSVPTWTPTVLTVDSVDLLYLSVICELVASAAARPSAARRFSSPELKNRDVRTDEWAAAAAKAEAPTAAKIILKKTRQESSMSAMPLPNTCAIVVVPNRLERKGERERTGRKVRRQANEEMSHRSLCRCGRLIRCVLLFATFVRADRVRYRQYCAAFRLSLLPFLFFLCFSHPTLLAVD